MTKVDWAFVIVIELGGLFCLVDVIVTLIYGIAPQCR